MLAMLATLLFAGALGAQANERIRFQARLTDSGGTAIIVGTNVTFNLYTSPTGGTPVWTESATIVPNNNGVFTTELGATTAFTGVDFSQVLYLGITVDTDPEMTPRYLMTAQALAHYARNAGLLDGLDSSAFAQLGAASSTFTGDITAASFTGDGSGLTSLSSSALTGPLPSLDGSAITNLNASAISSGTLSDARLTPNIPLLNAANNTFTGALTAGSLSGNGAGVTNVDAALLGGLARAGFAELTGATFTGGVTATTFTGNGAALTNVNALTLLGNNWASPAAIGGTTPNSGAFTTLSSNGLATLNSLAVTGAAGTDTLNVASTSSLTGAVTLGNDAATPVAGTVAIHDDQAANAFTGTLRVLTGGLTGNRTYSLPDNTGTLALLSDITGGGGTGSFTTLSTSALATLNSLSVTNNAGVGGALTVTGGVTAASFTGDGSALTALNATALTSGTVPAARLTGSYAIDITGNAATASSASSVPAAGIVGTLTDAQVTDNLTINTTSTITGSNGLIINSGGVSVTNGSITGDLIGNVTGNVSGTAAGFTGNLAGDVTGPQGSTLIATGAVTSTKILDGTIAGTDLAGNIGITTTGGITAATFTGNGSALTNVDAATLGGLARAGFAELTGATFAGGVSAPAVTVTSTALTTDLQFSATPGALAADFTGASFLTTVATAGANLVRGTQFSVLSGGTGETQGVSVGTEHTAVIASPGALAGMPDVVGLFAEARNTNATSTTLSIGMIGSADNTQAGVNVGVVGSASSSTYQSFGLVGMANASRTDVETFSDAFAGQSAALLLLNTQATAGNYGLYVEADNNVIDGDLFVTGTINATITGTATDSLALGGVPAANYALSADVLALAGGTMAGAIDLNSNNITNGGTITATSFVGALTGNADTATTAGSATTATTATNALNLGGTPAASYALSANVLALGGGTMTGVINLNTNNITNGGTITATNFVGGGAGLTGVTAASVAANNVTDGNLTLATGNLTLTGGTFTGSGAGITNVDALTLLGGDWANPGAIGSTTANSGAFTTLSSANLASLNSLSVAAGATIDGNTSLNTTSGNLTIGNAGLVTVNAAPSGITNAVTVNTTGIGSTTGSIQEAQGLQVFGTSNPLATRAASLRGVMIDAGSTTAGREVRGTQGTAFLTGNQSTTGANAGYFGAQYAGGSDLSLSMSGVSADAEVTAAPTNAPTAANQLIGGRFGANGDNAGAATALGTVSTALNTVARTGSNTGSLAWAAGSTTSNVGVFGTANATLAQLQTAQGTLIGTGTSVGVYAYNPTAGATQYALYADGNSRIVGNLTVTGTITGSISGTAGDSLLLNGQNGAFYLDRTNHTGNLPTAALTGTYTSAVTLNNVGNAFTGAFTGNGAGLTSVNAATLGGLATTDFMRSTGAVNESINGNKTFLGSVFVGELLGAIPGQMSITDGNAATLTFNGLTGSLTASGTVSAANVNATSVTLSGGNLNLATGNILNGGSASLTSATVSGAVTAGSVDTDSLVVNTAALPANIGNVPHWIEVPIPAFTAGSPVDANLILLPAGAVVHGAKIKHSASFTGTNTSFTISVGTVGAETSLIPAFDVFQSPSNTGFSYNNVVAHWNHGSPTQIVVRATCDSSADSVGAGAGSVWLLVSVAD
jgi:hypothetical protein